MATVPLSGTNIRLLSDIPFSNDYKHTRWFDNKTQQTNYFTGRTLVHSMAQANFQRIEGRNFIAVPLSIDQLWGTNYLMFQNAQYNNKWFYAFVTKLEYAQKQTTYVHFEIDVLQTWRFEMEFKPSYVVREHCKLWNGDGSPVINTIDEGLDYGSDYDIVGAKQYTLNQGILFLVIVAKSTLHILEGESSPNNINATINGIVQPLSYYIHPFGVSGITPDVVIDGVEYGLSQIRDLLNSIYTQTNAVNNIVSMYVTDHLGIDVDYSTEGFAHLTFNSPFQSFDVVDINPDGALESETINTIYVSDIRAFDTTTIYCEPKYKYLGGTYVNGGWNWNGVDESKLLMYPYSVTILDDFKGNRVVLKNEYIDGAELKVDVMGAIGVSNKVAYIPSNYLTDKLPSGSGQETNLDKARVALDNAIIDQTPHDVSIINDMLAAFFQGNRNSLINQAKTIAFNGTMDIVDNTLGGIASLARLNPVGGLQGISGVVRGGQNAVLQMQGIQAKIKDISNMPPQLAKLGGNIAFEYGNGFYGFWVITKTVKPEYRKKLRDFFRTYGYKVNEVKIPNFHTRFSWNYVQTSNCNIVGSFNNEDLQELKSIFDSGITLWHHDLVGDYSAYGGENGVI